MTNGRDPFSHFSNRDLANLSLTGTRYSLFRHVLKDRKELMEKLLNLVNKADQENVKKILTADPSLMFESISKTTPLKTAIFNRDIQLCKLMWELIKDNDEHRKFFVSQYNSNKKKIYDFDEVFVLYFYSQNCFDETLNKLRIPQNILKEIKKAKEAFGIISNPTEKQYLILQDMALLQQLKNRRDKDFKQFEQNLPSQFSCRIS